MIPVSSQEGWLEDNLDESSRAPWVLHASARLLLLVLSFWLLSVLICADCHGVSGSSLAATYNQANGLYAQGMYAEAIDVYDDLIESGVTNGFLFYNLGNAYFKEGEIGKAILWYSRARRILPRDSDVSTNLEFARRVRPDKLGQTAQPTFLRAVKRVVFGLNLSELAFISFGLYLLAVISVVLFILARGLRVRRATGRSSVILGVALFLCMFWLGGRIYHENRNIECVVMVRQVDAMSGPDDNYTKVLSLHEGTEALVEEEREGWYLIKLPSGLGGWIPARAAELI